MLRWNKNDIHKPKCGITNREKQRATEFFFHGYVFTYTWQLSVWRRMKWIEAGKHGTKKKIEIINEVK